MVVDEEEALRKLANDVLGAHGYKVHTAESDEKALKILEAESVDLLITDVSMRNMDGYELAYRAKKINPSINIQIVCATRANLMRHCINCDCRSPIV